MAIVKKPTTATTMEIHALKQGRIKLRMIGQTPMYFNSMGAKAWRDLLVGGGKKTTAALETEGIKKTSVQRLIFLPESQIQVWGKPYLKMDIVRSADMNKTPDVRTRAYLPNWCAEVDIKFVTPTLSAFSIVSLLQNAGTIVGIGDFRQEKGRGSYGTFSVASSEDMGDQQEIWDDITQEAREVQELAMEHPECADDQTRELMQFIQEERLRRAA